MKRKKIELTMTVQDIVVLLAEGNPGALDVCMRVFLSSEDALFRLLDLDDMNMRGPQIWVGYKDYCREDLGTFIEAIKVRSRQMVEIVNRECGAPNLAVTSGGSYR